MQKRRAVHVDLRTGMGILILDFMNVWHPLQVLTVVTDTLR
jgi:hypothetical protein